MIPRWFQWSLVAVSIISGIDAAARWNVTLGLAWACISPGLLWKPRAVAALIAALSFSSTPVLESNFNVLVGWVAAGVAIFPNDLPLVTRFQATVVYLFSGLSKIHPRWWTGESPASVSWWAPESPALLWAMGTGVIATELALAVAVWFRWRLAIPVAIVLHAGIVLFISYDLLSALRLLAFNGLLVSLVVFAVAHRHRRR